MHSRSLNFARIVVALRPSGPLLIRSGQLDIDPSTAEIAWLRAPHAVAGSTVYLPGPGLKGAFRSQAEYLLRSNGIHVCDVFDEGTRCRARGEDDETGLAKFQRNCAACRTFGSTTVRGRVSLGDAYPWPVGAPLEQQAAAIREMGDPEVHTNVAIDRETGATKGGALFRIETVTRGRFETEIVLRNFQLWQLALVGALLRRFDAGLARIGGAVARGCGLVRAEIVSGEYQSVAPQGGSFAGVASLRPGLAAEAGLSADDHVEAPGVGTWTSSWRGARAALTPAELAKVFDLAASGPLAAFLRGAQEVRRV